MGVVSKCARGLEMNATNLRPFLDPSYVGTTWADAQWRYLLDAFPAPWLFVAFYLFMTACYVAAGGFFWVLEQYRVFPQYRIQPGKWPKNADYIKTLKNIFQNYIVVILPMCFVAPPVLEFLGISAYAPLPSWGRLAFDLVFCLLVEDLFQYLFHRMLHLPSIYPLIHKVHHEWTTPFALAASYAHPAEVFILALAAFAGPLMCRPHLASFFLWLWVRQMDAVKTHSGWAWPGVDRILSLVPYYEGAPFHDYHHRTFLFNYASRFSFIDVLFRTYKEPYNPLEHLEDNEKSASFEAMKKGANLPETPFEYEQQKKKQKKKTGSSTRSRKA